MSSVIAVNTNQNTQGYLDVKNMAIADRIGEVIKRAIPKLPGEIADHLMSMLNKETLIFMAAMFGVWIASHLWGVGFFFDVIFVGIGIFTVGWGVFEGCEELYHFVSKTVDAKSEADLDHAAHHLACAINILGITIVSSLLLRSASLKVVRSAKQNNWRPPVKRKPIVGTPPPAGVKPTTTITRQPLNADGFTDSWGNITITRFNTSFENVKITLYHELVHRFFTPKLNFLRKFRVEMAMSGYKNSALLRAIEEAAAETFALAKVRRLSMENLIAGFKFPVANGYVTVSQLITEGLEIGTILIFSTQFYVTFSGSRRN